MSELFNEDKLRAEIVKTWGEYGAHAEAFDMLRKRLQSREHDFETMRSMRDKAQDALRESEGALGAANRNVERLVDDNARMIGRLDDLERFKSSALGVMQDSSAAKEVMELRAELEKARAMVETWRVRAEAHRAEADWLKGQDHELRDTMVELMQQREDLKTKLATPVECKHRPSPLISTEHIECLRWEIRKERTEAERLTTEIAALLSANKGFSLAVDAAQKEIVELKEKLAEEQRKKYGTPCSCESWISTCHDLESSNKRLQERERVLSEAVRHAANRDHAEHLKVEERFEDCPMAVCVDYRSALTTTHTANPTPAAGEAKAESSFGCGVEGCCGPSEVKECKHENTHFDRTEPMGTYCDDCGASLDEPSEAKTEGGDFCHVCLKDCPECVCDTPSSEKKEGPKT